MLLSTLLLCLRLVKLQDAAMANAGTIEGHKVFEKISFCQCPLVTDILSKLSGELSVIVGSGGLAKSWNRLQ